MRPFTPPRPGPSEEGLICGSPEAWRLELATHARTHACLKQRSGPGWGDSSVSKRHGPSGKEHRTQRKYLGHSGKPAVSPPTLFLYSITYSEHNWLPVSSMLGSKHQITKILWARRAQLNPGQVLLAAGLHNRTPLPQQTVWPTSLQGRRSGRPQPPQRPAPESWEPFIR